MVVLEVVEGGWWVFEWWGLLISFLRVILNSGGVNESGIGSGLGMGMGIGIGVGSGVGNGVGISRFLWVE